MTTHPLRSRNWFGRQDLDGFVHRSWLKSEGFSDVVFDGRPVIGIANSWSELTNCNAHLRQVAEAVKRGVWSAGGFPLEFPTISLGEVLMKAHHDVPPPAPASHTSRPSLGANRRMTNPRDTAQEGARAVRGAT